MAKHTTEPWIWLEEDEAEGTALCGCRLVRDLGTTSDPAVYQCPIHAAAPTWDTVLRDIAGLAQAQDTDDPDELRAALADIDDKASAALTLLED